MKPLEAEKVDETSISIIVPSYNRAQLVDRAILSVIAQTDPHWELIIIDDGSTDDTDVVVKKYQADKIRYVRQDKGGANKARNLGATMARHNYIAFLDSDDELMSEWVRSFREELRNQPSMIFCGALRIDESQELEVMPLPLGKAFNNAVGNFLGGCYVIEKKLFFEVGAFDEVLRAGQHTELAYRLGDGIAKKSIRLSNIIKPLVKVHVHEGPRIRQNYEALFLGSALTLAKHGELIKRDKQKYVDYLLVAGVNGVRTKRYDEAKKYFWNALKQKPHNPQLWMRWVLSNIPILRDRFWQTTNQGKVNLKRRGLRKKG